ncbi:hypothetical protein ACLN7X_005188 [Escherichia coli]|nr:hypothetical protein [Escherichia coli]EHW4894282.1 hypothetical protein [Escherichia coli]EHW5106468.1 hypothetical protein [Escherichia coli]EIH5900064.1 hypothetical protein [Escherichia coli]
MFVSEVLMEDKDNKGWVKGWAVVRSSPWHLVGVFATEEDAEMEARKMGDKYEVHYGSHRTGSDDFVWGGVTVV